MQSLHCSHDWIGRVPVNSKFESVPFYSPLPRRKEGEGTIKNTNVPCIPNKNETEMNNNVQVQLETDQDNQLEAIVIQEQIKAHNAPIEVGHRNPSTSMNKTVSGG